MKQLIRWLIMMFDTLLMFITEKQILNTVCVFLSLYMCVCVYVTRRCILSAFLSQLQQFLSFSQWKTIKCRKNNSRDEFGLAFITSHPLLCLHWTDDVSVFSMIIVVNTVQRSFQEKSLVFLLALSCVSSSFVQTRLIWITHTTESGSLTFDLFCRKQTGRKDGRVAFATSVDC